MKVPPRSKLFVSLSIKRGSNPQQTPGKWRLAVEAQSETRQRK